jgi:peptide chain release factor 1
MDQSGDVDQDLRELIRSDLREIVAQQKTLEEKIVLLLLPRDPNDDRNVMLEIRAGSYIYDRIYRSYGYIHMYIHACIRT